MTVASYYRPDGTRYLVSDDGRVYELRPCGMSPDELQGLAAIGYLTADNPGETAAPAGKRAGKTKARAPKVRRTTSGRVLALV